MWLHPRDNDRSKTLWPVCDRPRPSKILVECDIEEDDAIQKTFERYLAGEHQLTRNETNQIGFRLAKRLGHPKVHCVDWGIFPDDPVYNYANYAAQYPDLDAYVKERYETLTRRINARTEAMRPLPIKDQLIMLNQPEAMGRDHQGYFDWLRIARGQEYSGADYLSWWYGRNLKILTNIIRLTESSEDRILVIYGAGHLKLLNQLAEESGYYQVESPLKYLQGNPKSP